MLFNLSSSYTFVARADDHEVSVEEGALGSRLVPRDLIIQVEQVAVVERRLPTVRALDRQVVQRTGCDVNARACTGGLRVSEGKNTEHKVK